MKFGHKIKMDISAYDDKGRGLGEIEIVPNEMRPVVVPFAAIGDELEAVFVKREYGTKVCRLEKIVTPGPDRVPTPCPHAGICGGCLWQHLDYKAQLAEKERGIRELFKTLDLESKIRPIIPAEQTLGYRNRMDFCVGWNGEIGFKEYGSWNHYVDIQECLLLKPGIKEILQTVRDWMKESDLQPWDAKFHKGDIRYVVIRDGQNTKQRIVTLVIRDALRITQEARLALSDRLKSFCTSLLLGQLTKDTDLSLAETFETLLGNPWLEEMINGVTFRIHPNSFFQTNSAMAAKLQSAVLDSALSTTCHSCEGRNPEKIKTTKSDGSLSSALSLHRDDKTTLLDLYCGLGFFGITAATRDKDLQVTGYELDEEAIKLASQNAEMNEVGEQCHFFSGKAEDLSWQNIDAQYVILDPPRSGLHPRVIKALLDDTAKLQPSTLIYVSCNYHRLKEELPLLIQKFEVTSIQPLDLFPQTPHVEVVVTLLRK